MSAAAGSATVRSRRRRILPGFGPSLAFSLTYLTLLALVPLAACFLKAATLSPSEFLAAAWNERARAAYALTLWAAAAAAGFNLAVGSLLAWVLVRYRFFGRRFLDAMIDLPFALPTAVAGLVYSALYVPTGWYGQLLAPLGIQGAYSRLGIVLVLVFVGLPFVVRTVQPVLQSFDAELEEASACLGATRWQTLTRVIIPSLTPALLTGFALAFARGLGEYGSVVFISGNIRFKTEIAPVLVVEKLDEFAYAEATAVATVLLAMSLVALGTINLLERWSRRHAN
ncbi:MAG TPA: sulfate ABC transporter permease subunit CysT [Planctomycetia bacterium]|nr:sulfate ABC transporter permease subunit CysT [Planctomycetia bacterium]